MNSVDGATVKQGDRVRTHDGETGATVGIASPSGKYVQLLWSGTKRPDVLSRQSPLWAFLVPEFMK